MELLEKVKILSGAAKYDVSCSSSGSKRQNVAGGIGNAENAGICHSWSDDGRCISLLKVLFTNYCIYDCAYCINRRNNDIPRASFSVQEIVDLTINFYRRNYIEGLFLSSGIERNPDYTMENLLNVVKKLRLEHKYNGYIHLKVIPNANPQLVREAGFYADRISANIELPTQKSLRLLAPQKQQANIIKSIAAINTQMIENHTERKKTKQLKHFAPAGQSTQLIVGATPETDLEIVKLSENLYQSFRMKRVYYSGYIPINNDSRLPALNNSINFMRREHRLYQADWLLRYYKFKANEILDENNPYLDNELDPKAGWAIRNLQNFPVEINKASYEILLRIPGLGVLSAKRILAMRRFAPLNFENLKKIGVVLKRARYFITCQGKYYEKLIFEKNYLRNKLLLLENKPAQLKLFGT
jgi:putative DNA modification/repair radical SAM protein